MKHLKKFIFLFALATLSCDSEKITELNTANVSFSFTHLVDGSPLVLDQIEYKNALNQEFSIKTVKYFISQVTLYKEDNTTIDLTDIMYVDVRSPETLIHPSLEKIAVGNYSGISFILGLSPEENVSGRFTTPPESLMEWPLPMGGGYHYMKLEGEFKTPDEQSFFNFHSGMLGGTAYEIHINLSDLPFNVSNNGLHVQINMEIQNWFNNPNDWDFSYFGPAIMGNPEAQETVQENGQDVFSIEVIDGI